MIEEQTITELTEELRYLIDQLHEQMYSQLFVIARSALQDSFLAEEAVQEVFAIACSRANVLMSHPNPRGWIMVVLHNAIRSTRKNRAKVNAVFISMTAPDGRVGDIGDTPEPSVSPLGETDLDITCAALVGEDNYRVFKAYVLKQMTILEASKVLGISMEACKKRMQRIRKTLQKNISE